MASTEQATAIADPLSIGDRIREARKQVGFSQMDLARKVGVTQPAVANWESGVHDPRRLMLAKIADALMVSPDWLASGARSPAEADKHPAAAYIRRPIQHTPVISFTDAARLLDDPDADPHAVAEDYIPVTSGAEKIFALFVDDEAVDLAFPKETLVVIDYSDRRPADGAFGLFVLDGPPVIRRWRDHPPRLEPASASPAFGPIYLDRQPGIIGCVRVSIRVH
jgi:transcriptional regulator with XRE-family HTH domain